MLERWQRRRQANQLRRQLRAARRSGEGLYVQDWELTGGAGSWEHPSSLVEAILGWCRATLATCRRPRGIDHFDLALACRAADSETLRRVHFRGVRPPQLYADDGLAAQLHAFLARMGWHDGRGLGAGLRLAVALFSCGGAADTVLPTVRSSR